LPASDPRKVASPEEGDSDKTKNSKSDFENLPVGSLRFLRSQEALESDLNSRKVTADKERTGESGSLAEVKRAFLQYDFPAYSTGEVQRKFGVDRRAIGHGSLAERAILPALPEQDEFPYSIRITSEVTDSNGSSSMATVCGATLALLDAGVPLKAPIAGVSVGVAIRGDHTSSEEDPYSILLDITGTEDHVRLNSKALSLFEFVSHIALYSLQYGGMDLKVAGTRDGVTAIQLDVKEPLPIDILVQGLNLAKLGRIKLLDAMDIETKRAYGAMMRRKEPKSSAPRVEIIRFDPQRKRDLVGPGGVILRQLEDRYGVSLDLTQEGQCLLFGANPEMVETAKWTIMDLVSDVEEGGVYVGTVIEIKDFGAVIELLRNKEGLLHVSEIVASDGDGNIRSHPGGAAGYVSNHLRIGQKVKVLCTGVDPVQGSIKLSQKKLVEREEFY
jgi:polyribonucleotide nucleotidyltransferase